MNIILYCESQKNAWNSFLTSSKNPHFIYYRDYMEYHSDRFADFSIMVYNEKSKLIAIMPANICNSIVYSHQGLTFGGLVVQDDMKTETMLHIFKSLLSFLEQKNIKKLIYKCMPYIYHIKPSEEDRYALFINNAKLTRRDVTSAIYLDGDITYSKGRKWMINKAKKNNIVICESSDFKSFWLLLEEVLDEKYNAKPTHALAEIEKLANNFRKNIRLFLALFDGIPVSGALIYENNVVAHTQYLANSSIGRDVGALDFLIDHLIKNIFNKKKYFDFGISNENQGRYLNTGLISQKEGFGARAVVHDFFELDINN